MDVLVLPISEQTTVLVLPNMYRYIEKLTLCKIRAKITVVASFAGKQPQLFEGKIEPLMGAGGRART